MQDVWIIEEIRFYILAPHVSRQFEQLDQFLQMLVVDFPWGAVVFGTDGCRFSNNHAHHAAGFHHTHGTQGFVGNADVASCHEKVVDVARVKTAIGNRVSLFPINTFAMHGV